MRNLDEPHQALSEREQAATDPALSELYEVVRRTWGFETLRPMQEAAVRCALDGRDALVVLPTGGGKSLCYQAPALVREGLTLVVSPLISLMLDQVRGLEACGVSAGMLTSVQDEAERRTVERALWERRLDLLYVAPEKLMTPGFLSFIERQGLSGLAVDEAHCISHWGHDFRPEYRQLGELKQLRPDLPIQAFTATATPEVRADIAQQLGLVDPEIIVGAFDRPELTYRVRPRGELVTQVMEVVERNARRAGIVYCLRRAEAGVEGRTLPALPRRAGRGRTTPHAGRVRQRGARRRLRDGRLRHGDRPLGRALHRARQPAQGHRGLRVRPRQRREAERSLSVRQRTEVQEVLLQGRQGGSAAHGLNRIGRPPSSQLIPDGRRAT